MPISRRAFLMTTAAALPAVTLASKPEQNWPGFRGPDVRGIAEGYPTQAAWNVDPAAGKLSGLLWRAEVPGLAHSSPIIWDDRIYLATAIRQSGKASLRIGYYGDVKPAALPHPSGRTKSEVSQRIETRVRSLRISMLSTMLADRGLGEWGFAALVEADGRRILFDTGARPDTVLKNAKELGVARSSCVVSAVGFSFSLEKGIDPLQVAR